jgi:hypothetical protein
VVSQLEEEFEGTFVIHGEVKGGMPKGDFREKLRATLPEAA